MLSKLQPEEFMRNKIAFKQYSEKFKKILKLSSAGGGEKAVTRHVKQHQKLLPMDRIKLLLDNEEDFLELSTTAGYKMEYGDVPKAGVLTGQSIPAINTAKIRRISCMLKTDSYFFSI